MKQQAWRDVIGFFFFLIVVFIIKWEEKMKDL